MSEKKVKTKRAQKTKKYKKKYRLMTKFVAQEKYKFNHVSDLYFS